jgi:eukaryotic-like serine/threonine-protein kinase
MALSSGTRLGAYEIVEQIGAGGMGEVYRARDTRLGRDVAIKVLPTAFTSDPERLARFEREARVLASLNHPHIAVIHGLEESHGLRGLVMELIEGPTLAEVLAGSGLSDPDSREGRRAQKRHQLPLAKTLDIAKQIAEALEAAHERGIIHRDLKPANIKITTDGAVKILDFGLAKAVATGSNADVDEATTVTADHTSEGRVIGTPAYMSPEQARGTRVDRRTDVWAFGCVLYEMLSGKRPFSGESVSDTLAAVLTAEPDWSGLPPDAPQAITHLLHRCLAKDPTHRLRDGGSVLLEIGEARQVPAATVEPSPGSRRRQRPAFRVVLALTVVTVAALAVWAWVRSRQVPVPAEQRFVLTLPASQWFMTGMGDALGLSPDGRTVVYRAAPSGYGNFQLFRWPLDRFTADPIAGTEDGISPFFSPDGRWMGFSRVGELLKVPVSGGPVQHVASLPPSTTAGIRGADWGSDDVIVFAETGSRRLMQVPAVNTVGMATPVFTPDDDRVAWYPQILPDSDAVLFTLTRYAPDAGEIDVVNRRTGAHQTVMPNAAKGRLLPTGHLVFVRGGRLWAVAFDRRRLAPTGEAVPIVDGVRVEQPGGAVQFAVADDGTLAYLPTAPAAQTASGAGNKQMVWLDRNGREQPLPLPARNYQGFSLSPDGTQAAFQIGLGDDADVWTSDLERGTLTQITTESGFDGNPLWTPDGREIVFETGPRGQRRFMSEAADGTGGPRLLAAFDANVVNAQPFAWSHDGATLLAVTQRDVTGFDVETVTAGRSEPLIQTPLNEMTPAISPDGRWIAYSSASTGVSEVYVQRFPELGDRRQVSLDGGWDPNWSADGREIVYLHARDNAPDGVMRVGVAPDPREGSPRFGTPEHLFDFSVKRYYGRPGIKFFDVSPDSRRMLAMRYTEEPGSADRFGINVVVNWTEELKRLVPMP